MAIKTVGVVGTGVIGASWTALFLAHGLKVLVADPGPDAAKQLTSYLDSVWPALQNIGLGHGASLENYKFVGTSLDEHYGEVDFVQEVTIRSPILAHSLHALTPYQNAPEKLDLKTKLLSEIDSQTRKDVVIASSSSGIPSSSFIAQCTHPERVLIGHPFNPPHLMPLVEIIPHPNTSATAINTALHFYTTLNRKPIHIKRETPGFVANRLQAALCNEAYSLVSRGIVSAEELDACVTSSLGPRWAVVGPLMANAMGGGGGGEGFRRLMEHLGPAMKSWTEDMREKAFAWEPDGIDRVAASVEEGLAGKDVGALEQRRDGQLVEWFKGEGERVASTS
jgi:3-hydroxyacyl-CoA dehydrogenase